MSGIQNEDEARKIIEITGQLKHLLDMGALGARAASTGSTLAPGDLIDLVWRLVFGKTRQESLTDKSTPGAVFLLSSWNGHPMLSWHLNHCPKEQIVMLLATAVAMVGKRMNNSEGIIDAMIATLETLKERQKELEEEDEKESGDLPH